MAKTSIYLTEEDNEFLRSWCNGNVSAAIRKCVSYVRNREQFKAELREVLGSIPKANTFENAGLENSILKMMED